MSEIPVEIGQRRRHISSGLAIQVERFVGLGRGPIPVVAVACTYPELPHRGKKQHPYKLDIVRDYYPDVVASPRPLLGDE